MTKNKNLTLIFCDLPDRAAKLFAPALLLALRLVWGWQFAVAGWGKLTHLEGTTVSFKSLEIPAPGFHALLVGAVECGGGALLIAGLATRLVSIPLAITMIVAAFAAHAKDFLGTKAEPVTGFDIVSNFFASSPGQFLVVMLVLFAFGAGPFSLDKMFCFSCCAKSCDAKKD